MDILVLTLGGLLAAFVVTGLGMCYGTILVPILLLSGSTPSEAASLTLVSQLAVGTLGTAFHFKHKNISRGDMKKLYLATVPAALMAIFGALANISLPSGYAVLYIALILLILGILLALGIKIRVGKRTFTLLSAVAGFNKGFTGTGFGPIIVSGGVFYDNNVKSSVAVGTFSGLLVSLFGSIPYLASFHFSVEKFLLLVPFTIFGSIIGPKFTKYFGSKPIASRMVGLFVILMSIIIFFEVIA